MARNIASLLVLFLIIYGLCWLAFGERAANRFASGTKQVARTGIEFVGDRTGRAAINYPLIAGIIVIIMIFGVMVLASGC